MPAKKKPTPQIRETVTPELLAGLRAGALQPLLNALPLPKRETLSPESQIVEAVSPQLIHQLSFSHLAQLLELPDDTQRRFYEIECIRGNWSVRELRRQVEFALGDLSNQVFVSRYAVELPRKEEMERFITQIGIEVVP